MLSEIAKQQLMKAGCFKGRRIDISVYQDICKRSGLVLFPAAKKFLIEFGDLEINDRYFTKYIDSDGVIHKEVSTNHTSTSLLYCCTDLDIERRVHTRVLCVGIFGNLNIKMYISKDGLFYCNFQGYGLVAENTVQFWNEFYGDVYGRATWEDLVLKYDRTMFRRDMPEYICFDVINLIFVFIIIILYPQIS